MFKKISNYVAPYLKQAGQLVMRILRPLLNTKLGKAAVEVYRNIEYYAIEGAHKVVDGAEWIFDKGSQLANYVGRKANDVVNWIGDTKIVKRAVGIVKNIGSFISSTTIFKTGVEIATYIFTKVSNFCTATVESYQYYNQCRTIARRIVNEKPNLIDEHTILRSCHEVIRQEKQIIDRNSLTDNSIRKIIESWRVPLNESLLKTYREKLNSLPKDTYSIDFVKSFFRISSNITNFKNELDNLLLYYAWTKQVSYFRKIKFCFQNNKPLSEHTISIKIDKIPAEMQFYINEAIEEILAQLQILSDNNEKAYESDFAKNNEAESFFINSSHHKNWIDYLEEILTSVTYKSVDFVFIEKTISVILSCISSMRDSNVSPSELEFSFKHQNKELKEALLKYTTSNHSKQKSKFLSKEMYNITKQIIANGDLKSHTNLIKHAVKYGYPLPLSTAVFIASAFDKFLKSENIYNGGIVLEIKDHLMKNVLVNYGNGKARLSMREFNGFVYICQSDYRISIGMSDQMNEEVDNAFFYEAFISYMKTVRDKFPKKAETLREGLLKELDNM